MKMQMVAIIALAVVGLMTGCSEDKLKVIHNNDKVSQLEQRLSILESVVQLQGNQLMANADAIIQEKMERSDEITRLEGLISALSSEQGVTAESLIELQELVASLSASTLPGMTEAMAALQEQIDAIEPTVNNTYVSNNVDITLIGFLHVTNTTIVQQVADLSSLVSQLNALEGRVNDLENEVQDLQGELASLEARVEALEQAAQSGAALTVMSVVQGQCNGSVYVVTVQVKNTLPFPVGRVKIKFTTPSNTDVQNVWVNGHTMDSFDETQAKVLITTSGGLASNSTVTFSVQLNKSGNSCSGVSNLNGVTAETY